jgi:hypothetical protein
MPKAQGPAPDTFVSSSSGRIAVFDARTGRRLQYLTNPPRGTTDGVDDLKDGTVWFTHSPQASCGGDLMTVPATGGAATMQVAATNDHGVGLAAVDRYSALTVYEDYSNCTPDGATLQLIVWNPEKDTRVALPTPADRSLNTFDLADGKLAFTARGDSHRTELYVVDVRTLEPGDDLVAKALRLPARQPNCSWEAPVWSDTALFVSETCELGGGGTSSPTVMQLDPDTYDPRYSGPVVDATFSVIQIVSNPFGHLLVWAEGGDTIGDLQAVDGTAVRTIHSGGCTSADPQPDPCPRAIAW